MAAINSKILFSYLTQNVALKTDISSVSSKLTDVDNKLDDILTDAPNTLNTLKELADSISDDSNFGVTMLNNLNNKANINGPTFTGTVSGITADMVGAYSISDIDIFNLTTNNLINYVNNKVDIINNNYVTSNNPVFSGTVSGIIPYMIGLGNVNNTSDLSKPISTLTQNALNLLAPSDSPTLTGNIVFANGVTISGLIPNMIGAINQTDLSNALVSYATTDSPVFSGNIVFADGVTISGLIPNMIDVYTKEEINIILSSQSPPSASVALDNPTIQQNPIYFYGQQTNTLNTNNLDGIDIQQYIFNNITDSGIIYNSSPIYDTQLNVFTIPQDGTYEINVSAAKDLSSDIDTPLIIYLAIDTIDNTDPLNPITVETVTTIGGTYHGQATGTILYNFNMGDKFYIYSDINGLNIKPGFGSLTLRTL